MATIGLLVAIAVFSLLGCVFPWAACSLGGRLDAIRASHVLVL